MADMKYPHRSTFTQISLFSVLLCGRYGGVTSLGEVKKLGDMAIGTMDRLDGEMLMINGEVFQACADGQVHRPGDDETIPFGTIAAFRADQTLEPRGISSYEAFEAYMRECFPNENIPLAIHFAGRFGYMKVRAVGRQEQDGTGLAEAAQEEAVFQLGDTAGDLMGFRLPGYVLGINAPGWHLHFIDADRKCGGHVVNFSMTGGMLRVCRCGDFVLRLPDDPDALAGLDLARDRSGDLRKAEAER